MTEKLLEKKLKNKTCFCFVDSNRRLLIWA